ncbi:MAG: hypothetical protein NVS4B6_18390 [Mycobacterium sp.]
MRQRVLNTVAAVVVAAPALTIGVATGNAEGATFVAFTQAYRRCDYSDTTHIGATGFGRPTAMVRTAGSDVIADVQLVVAIPDMPYDVRLIEVPRASASSCNGGEPGVVAGVLTTDDSGAGSLTLREPIASGEKGAWLSVSRPGEFGQTPDEFYSTDFIVPI